MEVIAIDGSDPNTIRTNFNVQHCHVRKSAQIHTKSRGAGKNIQCVDNSIQSLANNGTIQKVSC